MGEHRRKKKKSKAAPSLDFDAPLDHEKIDSGTIPWSAEELEAALMHMSNLYVTPADDWDRRKLGFKLVNDDGSVSSYRFNPDHKINQILSWLIDRFREQGLTLEAAMAHCHRLLEVHAFMHNEVRRLRDEK